MDCKNMEKTFSKIISDLNALRIASFTLADSVSKILIAKGITTEKEWLDTLTKSREEIANEMIKEAATANNNLSHFDEKEGPIEENDYIQIHMETVKKPDETVNSFDSIISVKENITDLTGIVGKNIGDTLTFEDETYNIKVTVLKILKPKQTI